MRTSLNPLSDLFSTEGADAVQAKGEDKAILVTQANVETESLGGDHAAFPGVPERGGRANQSTVTAGKWMLLKVKE